MPDLVNYSVTRLANASVNTPRWQVTGQIVDSKTQQTVIQDLTGNIFPNLLGSLTSARQDEWVEEVVQNLIFRRYGLA